MTDRVMAVPAGDPVCSVHDCLRPPKSHGLCNTHNERRRLYGDVMAGKPPRLYEWFEAHVMEPSDGCRIWTHTVKNGYGVIYPPGGGYRMVHILTCERWYGPRPEGMEACHTCGRGSSGCWAGEHLRWDTSTANNRDRFLHGTMPMGEAHHMATLTDAQIVEIRALDGLVSQRSIARQYKVSQSTIWRILHRHTRTGELHVGL